MNGVHPSDMELQQYVLDRSACLPDTVAHLDWCAECQAGIAAYGVLFGGLKQQPGAAFDFDVEALVLERVAGTGAAAAAPKSRKERQFNFMLGAMIFAIGGIPAWLFRKNAFYVFTGVSAFFLYLMLGAALMIVLLRILAMYKKYQRRMESLQFY
jgi:hypothetical protein